MTQAPQPQNFLQLPDPVDQQLLSKEKLDILIRAISSKPGEQDKEASVDPGGRAARGTQSSGNSVPSPPGARNAQASPSLLAPFCFKLVACMPPPSPEPNPGTCYCRPQPPLPRTRCAPIPAPTPSGTCSSAPHSVRGRGFPFRRRGEKEVRRSNLLELQSRLAASE